MVEIGAIVRGAYIELNKKHKYMWNQCPDCGKCRWTQVAYGKAKHNICQECRIKRFRDGHGNRWVNGSIKHNDRVLIKLPSNHPYYAMMTRNGYVKRSRLVIAENLGRALTQNEDVHHIDGDKSNDSLDNLLLLSKTHHMALHRAEIGKINKITTRLFERIEANYSIEDRQQNIIEINIRGTEWQSIKAEFGDK